MSSSSSINAVHAQAVDSCVTVTDKISKGDTLYFLGKEGEPESVMATGDVPIYHKVAAEAIAAGDFVIKYGEKIGIALSDIKPGDHVHIHNIKPVGYIEEA